MDDSGEEFGDIGDDGGAGEVSSDGGAGTAVRLSKAAAAAALFGKSSAKAAATSSSSFVRPLAQLPWVEKWRPKAMGDIASQEDVVRTLKAAVASGSLPHLLFYGPPGTGKTSTILALARELYGPELMKVRVMELNASDERGIAVVREKIKGFAASSVGSAPGSVPFKLIILDEADSLTPDAQAALRRTIETYSRVTRFCIICNYISRIIDPLASRCTKFRFKPLGRDAMVARLHTIAAAEGVEAAPDALHAVLDVAGGDMRKAVTFMQSAAELYNRALTPERVIEISGVFPDRDLEAVLAALRRGGLAAARAAAQQVVSTGYAISGVLERLADSVIAQADFPPAAKAAIVEKIAIAEKRLYDGADEELQLQDVFAHAARALAGSGAAIAADKERVVIM